MKITFLMDAFRSSVSLKSHELLIDYSFLLLFFKLSLYSLSAAHHFSKLGLIFLAFCFLFLSFLMFFFIFFKFQKCI